MEYKELRRAAGEGVTFEPVEADKRPFMIQTDDNVGAGFWSAFRDTDLIVVGVTHMSSYTNIHVREAYE